MRTIRRASSPSLYFAFAKKFRRFDREACFGFFFRSMLGRSFAPSLGLPDKACELRIEPHREGLLTHSFAKAKFPPVPQASGKNTGRPERPKHKAEFPSPTFRLIQFAEHP